MPCALIKVQSERTQRQKGSAAHIYVNYIRNDPLKLTTVTSDDSLSPAELFQKPC